MGELESAANYWSELLNYNIPYNTKHSFQQNLIQVLAQKYSAHWIVESPECGQAFREIVYDLESGYIDPVLLQAAELTGFNFQEAYGPNRGIRMWVDPGEVEVCYTEGPPRQHVIYQQQSRSRSPVQDYSTVMYPQDGAVYYYPENEMYYNPQCEYVPNMYSNYTPNVQNNQMMYDTTNAYPVQLPIEAGI